MKTFEVERNQRIRAQLEDIHLTEASAKFIQESIRAKYSYNFSWMGRPIIQYPQDIVAVQDLVWSVKPDLIIETGIAHGGSLILSASMLALLDLTEAIECGKPMDPRSSNRKVIGVDVDIRSQNREAIEDHPMSSWISMIEGSSIDPGVIAKVKAEAAPYSRVLVFLDSNHTHEHVLAELDAYSSFVSPGSYCVVFDTVVANLPSDFFPDRPWGPGDNPKTAVCDFLKTTDEFEIDSDLESKLLITVAPGGFLRRKSKE